MAGLREYLYFEKRCASWSWGITAAHLTVLLQWTRRAERSRSVGFTLCVRRTCGRQHVGPVLTAWRHLVPRDLDCISLQTMNKRPEGPRRKSGKFGQQSGVDAELEVGAAALSSVTVCVCVCCRG